MTSERLGNYQTAAVQVSFVTLLRRGWCVGPIEVIADRRVQGEMLIGVSFMIQAVRHIWASHTTFVHKVPRLSL
jgi:hypothetical protein